MDLLGQSDRSAMVVTHELEVMRDETSSYFELGDADLERRYGPDKWSVRFVLHHLADVEAVELERIHRTLSEPRPNLPTIDADAWAKGLGYEHRSIEVSRALFEAARNSVLQYAHLFYEAKGDLTYVHSEYGPLSLREEFEKIARHNAKHLGHIRTALSNT